MKLFCCTHRQYPNIPNDGITIPVLVGMNNADYEIKTRDYIPDISKENLLFNESELEMYINKYVKNEDIIGLIQYSCRPELSYSQISEILKTKKVIAHKNAVGNLYNQYCGCHWSGPIDAMIDILKDNDIDSKAIDCVMGSDILFSRHIFISTYEIYQSYLDWKFKILFQILDKLNIHTVEDAKNAVINHYGPNYNKIDYQSRIVGYLGERLQTVWLRLNYSLDDIHIPKYKTYPKVDLG